MAELRLRPEHLAELRRLIAKHLPQSEVRAFGSRVTGTCHDTSDLDLVVINPAEPERHQGPGFWELKEALSESNLPFLVDLSDWARMPESFRENIRRADFLVYSPPGREADACGARGPV